MSDPGKSNSDRPSGLDRYSDIALIHDFLIDVRGGERVFLAIAEMFPNATLYSPIYDPVGTEFRFEARGVETSYLQHLGPTASNFRRLLPLYPRAVESLDLSRHDLILSSSSAWSHGVIANRGQRHICYSHNPFRYAWDQRSEALRGRSKLVAQPLGEVLGRWRAWDLAVAREVDLYVANGTVTRERIARCLGRSSSVLHPPVALERFTPGKRGGGFAVLSELMPHKRIDIAVQACSRAGAPLTVIGDGPDLSRLQALAGPTVKFAGRLSDAEVADALATSDALIQCATEEFGIASVEAQAAGIPVIAHASGGALEIVAPGVTGVLFDDLDVESLAGTLRQFDSAHFTATACRENADRFSVEAFALGIGRAIEALDSTPKAPRERSQSRRHGLWRRARP